MLGGAALRSLEGGSKVVVTGHWSHGTITKAFSRDNDVYDGALKGCDRPFAVSPNALFATLDHPHAVTTRSALI